MSNIVPYNELQQMATSVAKSGMFNLKSVEQATTLMLIAQAEGIAPVQAVQMYSVINGMPSLKSTEVQSRFQNSGGKVEWLENSDEKVVCKLSHESYGEITITWTIDRAKKAGFAVGKDGKLKDNWVKMPQQMMRARCVSEGVRAIYPSCLNNMYSVDEMNDTINTPSQVAHTMPTIEVEIEELTLTPEPTIGALKLKLANKLKELSFSDGDIRDFAAKFGLGDNKQLLERVVNEPILLNEMVVQFEEESASES